MSDLAMNAPAAKGQGMSKDEKFVIFDIIASTGTVFESLITSQPLRNTRAFLCGAVLSTWQ